MRLHAATHYPLFAGSSFVLVRDTLIVHKSDLFRSFQVLYRRGMRQGSAKRPCVHGLALPGWLSSGTLSL